jgi:hypothetical protein
MKLLDFSKSEQEDCAVKMCIHLGIKKFALITNKSDLPPPNKVTCTVENGTFSSVVESSFAPPHETKR